MARAADRVLALSEWSERVTRVVPSGTIINVFTPFGDTTRSTLPFDSDVLHFYVVLFTSVFLVFPGLGAKRRLIYLGVGLAALFFFHVVALLIAVECLYALVLPDTSSLHYTDAERSIYKGLGDTVLYFAVQTIPAAALALLVVMRGGLGRSFSALGTAPVGGSARKHLGRRAAFLTAGAASAAVVAAFGLLFTWKVGARQADKQTMIGYQLLAAGQHDRAAAEFEKALDRQPRMIQPRVGLGLSRFLRKDFPRAAQEFGGALAIDPRNREAHLHMGNTLLEMGRAEQAARHFLELMEDADFLNDGRACRQLGYLQRALQGGLPAALAAELAAKMAPLEARCPAVAGARPSVTGR